MLPVFLLAQSDGGVVEDTLRNWDYRPMIVLGALVLLSLALFIWAAFFRKRRGRQRHHFHRPAAPAPTAHPAKTWSLRRLFRRKHHRHRYREERVNPTLAQTGGLPPIRTEEEPPPVIE